MSDKKSTAKEPLTNKEIALELTRLQVMLDCAYISLSKHSPSVYDYYENLLKILNEGS